MPVVGTLTVDLVANTATFTADLGKAGNSLDGFGKAAKDAGDKVDYSMMEARHGVMMLGEEFGVHLPRGLTTFIASLGPVGEAMAAAFPFLAVALGAKLLIDHIIKLHEEADKLTESQAAFGQTVQGVFNDLDDKLLRAGIKMDELAGNHIAALRKELMLIDHASMDELSKTLDKLAKSADASFAQMKASWYMIGEGSAGASHALGEFKRKYDELLSHGKEKEASDLLKGTLDQANAFLQTKKGLADTLGGHLGTDKELSSQQELVDALNAQVTAASKIAALKKADEGIAKTEEAGKEASDQNAIYNEQQRGLSKRLNAEFNYTKKKFELAQQDAKKAQHLAEQIDEEQFAATRAVSEEIVKAKEEAGKEELSHTLTTAKEQNAAEDEAARHKLAMHGATLAETLAADQAALTKDYDIQKAAYDKDISLLNPTTEVARIQALNNRKLEAEQKYLNDKKKLDDKAAEDYQKALDKVQSAVAKTAAKSIMENKNMGQAFAQLGQQMAEVAMENLMKSIMIRNIEKEHDAADAARGAYTGVMKMNLPPYIGFPLAIASGAEAFAGVMAFAKGGEVPGVGSGDSVPAMLTPGETVVTKSLTAQVKNNTGSGGHTFLFQPAIHAIDAEGVDRMLTKHAATFHKHVLVNLRKMNKKG